MSLRTQRLAWWRAICPNLAQVAGASHRQLFEQRQGVAAVVFYYMFAITPITFEGGQAQTAVINDSTRSFTETAQPRDALKLWTQYEAGKYRTTLNLNRFGGFVYTSNNFGPEWTVDLDLAFRVTKDIEIAVGGENVLRAPLKIQNSKRDKAR